MYYIDKFMAKTNLGTAKDNQKQMHKFQKQINNIKHNEIGKRDNKLRKILALEHWNMEETSGAIDLHGHKNKDLNVIPFKKEAKKHHLNYFKGRGRNLSAVEKFRVIPTNSQQLYSATKGITNDYIKQLGRVSNAWQKKLNSLSRNKTKLITKDLKKSRAKAFKQIKSIDKKLNHLHPRQHTKKQQKVNLKELEAKRNRGIER